MSSSCFPETRQFGSSPKRNERTNHVIELKGVESTACTHGNASLRAVHRPAGLTIVRVRVLSFVNHDTTNLSLSCGMELMHAWGIHYTAYMSAPAGKTGKEPRMMQKKINM